MSHRACHCGAQVELPSARQWGTWAQCSACKAFVTTTGHAAPVFELQRSGPPPGWAPTVPMRPASRIEFAFRQPSARVFLTTCKTCRVWLPIDGSVGLRFVRCGACGARRSLAGEHLDAQVFVLFRDSGALFAEFPHRGLDEERISMPTRPAPSRAWVEREDRGACRVTPLLQDDVPLSAVGPGFPGRIVFDEGWFLVNENARTPLASGASLDFGVWSARGGTWFGQNGACEPREHFAALDERPTDAAAWEVWADALEERDETEAANWIRTNTRTDLARSDQLGFLAPLERRGLARVTWNAFGFVDRLVLGGALLRMHPFVLEARFAPAIRYLQSLRIELETPEELVALSSVLSAAPLPRALRSIELSGSRGDVSAFDAVIASARRQCPWFGR